MAYLHDVERVLGTQIASTLYPIVKTLEGWGCSEFHAAVYIHWIIRGRHETDKVKKQLERLAHSAATLGPGVVAILNRAKVEIVTSSEEEWIMILTKARRLGFDRDQIDALFDGFIAGAVTLKDLRDLRSALSRVGANGSTLSR